MHKKEISKQRWDDVINVSEVEIPAFSPVSAFYNTTDLASYTSGSLLGVAGKRYPVDADGKRILLPVTLPERVEFTTGGPQPIQSFYTNSHIGFNGPLVIASGGKGRCTWDCSPGIVLVNSADIGHADGTGVPVSPLFTAKLGTDHLVNAVSSTTSTSPGVFFTNIFKLIGVLTHPFGGSFPLGYVVRYRHNVIATSTFPVTGVGNG